MASPARLGRFESQVRLALVLLVVLLAAFNLVNLLLLGRASFSLASSERNAAIARGRDVVRSLGPETLVPGSGAAIAWTESDLAGFATRFDCSGIAVLDAGGRERVRGGALGAPTAFETLEPEDRHALESGRAVPIEAGHGDPESRTVAALVPVLDSAGGLVAIVEVAQRAPELGWIERAVRWLIVVQIGGVVVVGALALLLARWVSRPYRAIVDAADRAGLAAVERREMAGPLELAETFAKVALKLRDQEKTLESLGAAAGGLGELVRFANGAARDMGTGVLVVDRRGRVAAANESAARLLGAADRDPGSCGAALRGEGGGALRGLLDDCLVGGRPAAREVVDFAPADGSTLHLGVTVSPAAGDAGALVLMTDLTEIRGLEDRSRARDSLAAVGQVAAGIAHEFRNALATILGWARTLEKREDPRVRGPAREIVREVEASRAAVDAFLAYARPPEPNRTRVDLAELVRGCLATAPDGLEVEVEGEFGAVIADPSLLRRVLGNLLQNAADAGSEAGRPIHVRIAGRLTGSGRHVQVDFDDDGPGIPEDRREGVFTPFVTTRARGTGLGLALVRRTVEDMGGAVEVVEGTRGGACFRLRLPVVGSGRSMVSSSRVV